MEKELFVGVPASPRRREGPWKVEDLVSPLQRPNGNKEEKGWLGQRAPPNDGGSSSIPRVPGRCDMCLTPENHTWRAGPNGPKTLCNACGLKYSREMKKVELTLSMKSPKSGGQANI